MSFQTSKNNGVVVVDVDGQLIVGNRQELKQKVLDELEAIGYLPHSGQAWSHHNYTDVEKRQTETRSQAIRALLEQRRLQLLGCRGLTCNETFGLLPDPS